MAGKFENGNLKKTRPRSSGCPLFSEMIRNSILSATPLKILPSTLYSIFSGIGL